MTKLQPKRRIIGQDDTISSTKAKMLNSLINRGLGVDSSKVTLGSRFVTACIPCSRLIAIPVALS
jgi:hypothetical protein